MNKHRTKHDSGMALLMALLFISIALLAIGALSARLMNQRLQVNVYQNYQETFQGLESATITSKIELETGEDGIVGMEGWVPSYADDNQPNLPAFDDAQITGEIIEAMPQVKLGAYAINWYTDGRDSNGDGTIDDSAERWMYTIYAQAEYDGLTRRSEVIYEGGDVNVWRNAIFAGTGQAGGLINGNVSIHGSVHLLGDALPEGQTAIAAIDLSGTSLIHNNYVGMPAGLDARIPALETTIFNGDTVETLDAVIRVKNGLVGLSGNSEIGEIDIAGNAFKETMDGTFVNDGWTGNKVIDDGDRGDPLSVFSDNGWDEEYDVGDKVPFPLLTDDWRDPETGARTMNPATGLWYTHEEFFNQVLLADPAVPTDGVYTGDITLNVAGNANSTFYWNATTNQVLTGAAATAAVPAATDDYIKFEPTKDLLTVNGQIRINGNLYLKGQGSDRTINYSGRAAILDYGNISIDANLLTCNNGDKTNTNLSFPVNNILGLMATQDMTVGSTSQLTIMGAFYAQNKITSAKQTNVLGTFVSNYFDMGTNVPSIFQVPTLADNLPLGMIGNYPIMALSQISWRELGI